MFQPLEKRNYFKSSRSWYRLALKEDFGFLLRKPMVLAFLSTAVSGVVWLLCDTQVALQIYLHQIPETIAFFFIGIGINDLDRELFKKPVLLVASISVILLFTVRGLYLIDLLFILSIAIGYGVWHIAQKKGEKHEGL
jgi:hypothetical protein